MDLYSTDIRLSVEPNTLTCLLLLQHILFLSQPKEQAPLYLLPLLDNKVVQFLTLLELPLDLANDGA